MKNQINSFISMANLTYCNPTMLNKQEYYNQAIKPYLILTNLLHRLQLQLVGEMFLMMLCYRDGCNNLKEELLKILGTSIQSNLGKH